MANLFYSRARYAVLWTLSEQSGQDTIVFTRHLDTRRHRNTETSHQPGAGKGREPGASLLYHFHLSEQQTRVTNIRINHTTNPKPKLSTAICNSI